MSDPPGTYRTADRTLCSPAKRPRATRHQERAIAEIKGRLMFAPRLDPSDIRGHWRDITKEAAEFISNAPDDIEDLIAIIEEAPS